MTGLSEADLHVLLADGVLEEEQGDGEDQALHTLSRRISGQYVDVLAGFVSQVRGGTTSPPSRQQALTALDALRRLAGSSGDRDLLTALDGMAALVTEEAPTGRRFRIAVQESVLALAALLPDDDARRLRELVSFDRRALPLLDQLGDLRGIGPRRLERLYRAGLYTVEAVCAADPAEVAQATGLPRALARQVVEASERFAVAQRRQAAHELTERAAEVHRALAALRRSGASDPEVAALVHAALAELQRSIALLGSDPPEPHPSHP